MADDIAPAAAPADDAPAGTPAQDDQKSKFKAALERKKAHDAAGHGEDHLGGARIGAASNDKTRRQFRRKSG